MTLIQSDVAELLDAIAPAATSTWSARAWSLVLQALIEAEGTEHIGAARVWMEPAIAEKRR